MQDRSRWIALVVLCTGMLMIVLDMTIVNVALPSIQARLGFSPAALSHIFPVTLLIGTGAGLCFPALMALARPRAITWPSGSRAV
jgi:MFS family permease